MRYAFYGRVSTEDQQDPEASRNWQLERARAVIGPGGQIVTEFFDIGQSRSLPWKRRPRASALLDLLKQPARGFEAVVVGEPQRAFYGNQYGLTFPVFVHYGVELWVPEVGGAIDPESEAHDLVMSVFGGMSKGERNRIKVRVRSAMAAQAKLEGRYLGGRPPYGYRLADARPHPNPGKAAEGRRLHRLEPDPAAAPVVRRIFTSYLVGQGLYSLAEDLTRDGIPCPSAHDPERNTHRCGTAWSKGAIRTILKNPRYTGHQVWNRQRKDERLLDVDNVALGHATKLVWNNKDAWISSTDPVHEPLVDADTFARAQTLLAANGKGRNTRDRQRVKRTYGLRGLLLCGLCQRRMQGQYTRHQPYYRCRFPTEYGLANKVIHPRNVYLAERDILPTLDNWLVTLFAPHRLRDTLTALAESQPDPTTDPDRLATEHTIRECDAKLTHYRKALEAGTDPTLVTQWITEIQAHRAQAVAATRTTHQPQRLATSDIDTLIHELGDLRTVIDQANPDDKADVYRKLGLALTYRPGKHEVRAEIALDAHMWGYGLCPRGDLNP
ncbi:recombinase family protein [Saccharomonospora sp. NPDC046836]|uniref:recombinase family protein n=1 Tax=Saccharomonospora sp. NPDC046836 TaxID=3156921 RepID=UPI0033D54417